LSTDLTLTDNFNPSLKTIHIHKKQNNRKLKTKLKSSGSVLSRK
jgi:hypothetical protein